MSALGVLVSLVDLVITIGVLGMALVGAGLLVLVARFLYDEWRGTKDPVAPALADADLPHVLVQIPVYNEGIVVENAMRCAAALDWPRDRLTIQLLDDSVDGTVDIAAAVIAELRAAGMNAVHVRREDRSGFKAAACATGLRPVRCALCGDARRRFPPARRTGCGARFPCSMADPAAGFVQSRCEFANFEKSWLTRAQGLILDGHFLIEQRSRAKAGWLFQFNGTGGIWRRATIDACGGWLDYSLTEDLDLTIRTALKGYHGIFLQEPAVPGQMPEELRDWRRQQRRWSNGFIQVAKRTIGPMWNAPWPLFARLSAIWLVMHQVFFPFCAITLIALALGVLLHLSIVPYLPLLAFIVVMVLAVAIGFTLAAISRAQARSARHVHPDDALAAAAFHLSRGGQCAEDHPDGAGPARTFQAHAETRARTRFRFGLIEVPFSERKSSGRLSGREATRVQFQDRVWKAGALIPLLQNWSRLRPGLIAHLYRATSPDGRRPIRGPVEIISGSRIALRASGKVTSSDSTSRQFALGPPGDENRAERDQADPEPVHQGDLFAEKKCAEDRDEDDAELVDRRDLRRLAEFQRAKIAEPRRARRQPREEQEDQRAARQGVERLPLMRRCDDRREGADDDHCPDERREIRIDVGDADLGEDRRQRREDGGQYRPGLPSHCRHVIAACPPGSCPRSLCFGDFGSI